VARLLLPVLAGAVVLAGPLQAADAPPGASSCTGCHASAKIAGSELPRIAGRKAADIVAAMAAYRSGARPSSVMGRLAKGFDAGQTDALAAWFAAQPE
jgi:cytochrome subunit of sulfide dehydrogenase